MQEFGADMPIGEWLEQDHSLHEETLRERIMETMESAYAEKEQLAGIPVVRHFEKAVMLQILDVAWKEHLAAMDYLRQGIGLRGYAQKDPKQEYKREAFEMFSRMLESIKQEVVEILSKLQLQAPPVLPEPVLDPSQFEFQHEEFTGLAGESLVEDEVAAEEPQQPFVRADRKVGRNEPCPCGSGKKYKHCHGKLS